MNQLVISLNAINPDDLPAGRWKLESTPSPDPDPDAALEAAREEAIGRGTIVRFTIVRFTIVSVEALLLGALCVPAPMHFSSSLLTLTMVRSCSRHPIRM